MSAALVIRHFGSKDGLVKACDDYIVEQIRREKSEAIRSTDFATWLVQMAEIESYAPMMAYLVRSMQSGSALAKTLWRRMIDNTEAYLDEGVRAGTVKPSRDPRARARYLALTGGGGEDAAPGPRRLRRVHPAGALPAAALRVVIVYRSPNVN